MKFLINIGLAALLTSGAGAEAVSSYEEAPRVIDGIGSVVVARESRSGQRVDGFRPKVERLKQQKAGQGRAGADERRRLFFDCPVSGLFFVSARGDDAADSGEEQAAAPQEREGRGPDEPALRKALTTTRKQLEAVRQKIEGDHALWTRSGEQMKESRERIAELEASLARERLKFDRLRQSLARIEREHNDDHDREEGLAAELAGHEEALREIEGKHDAITRLEKQAAELRKQALELRQRAEELRTK